MLLEEEINLLNLTCKNRFPHIFLLSEAHLFSFSTGQGSPNEGGELARIRTLTTLFFTRTLPLWGLEVQPLLTMAPSMLTLWKAVFVSQYSRCLSS